MTERDDQVQDELRAELSELGERRRELRAQQSGLRLQIRYAALEADEAGLTIVEIARLVGMTRRALYQLLDVEEDQ
jgi:hypothetical protein